MGSVKRDIHKDNVLFHAYPYTEKGVLHAVRDWTKLQALAEQSMTCASVIMIDIDGAIQFNKPERSVLTPTQHATCKLYMMGFTLREIAVKLDITHKAVDFQLQWAMKKVVEFLKTCDTTE